ncbi:hypothetical protein BD779DRAFT_1658674 [Infundibulicybe gibba]|nr:hypothetical protein BD779DRAFT_1658674 [Infundibulicybe gibba]
MTKAYQFLTPAQVEHFLQRGYVVIRDAFTKEKGAEWTKTIWTRLDMNPDDKMSWDRERIHMPVHRREDVATFAPKAWAAIQDLLGGEERIDQKSSTWGDGFIVNLGKPDTDTDNEVQHPHELNNWHVDGDFFVHFLDSPEQALLVIPIYSDIEPLGGGTMICPDGLTLIARYLAAHPEGVLPTGLSFTPSTSTYANHQDDPGYWSHLTEIKNCKEFVEITGSIGDVVLLHPLMLHSATRNYTRIPRIITNPPVEDYSLVELKTLQALGVDKLEFKRTTERRMIVPKRMIMQNKMREEEERRLANQTAVGGH